MKDNEIRRGDIWFAILPRKTGSHVQGGIRPVLVYQSDYINERSPVVNVLPITTKIKRLDLACHVVIPRGAGLRKKSMVLTEQAFTLDKSDLFNFQCNLSDKTMKRVDRARRYVEGGDTTKRPTPLKRKPKYDSKKLIEENATIKE